MTDIVERLVHLHLSWPNVPTTTVLEAADEIELLRAALKPFAERVDALSLSSALGHITREHLLEARRALEEVMIEPEYDTEDMAKIGEYDSLRAEIERLRRENGSLRATIQAGGMNAAALADNELLRAALSKIVAIFDGTHGNWYDATQIARRALCAKSVRTEPSGEKAQ